MATLADLRGRFRPVAAIDSQLHQIELEILTTAPPLEMPTYYKTWSGYAYRISQCVGAGARHESLRTPESYDRAWNYLHSIYQAAAYRASMEGDQ